MDAHKWFRQEVEFSDWKNRECDYSTNAIVTQWYTGKPARYLRESEIEGFKKRLADGDTLIVGLDYYALTPISARFVPDGILIDFYKPLMNGRVFRFKVFNKGGNEVWGI